MAEDLIICDKCSGVLFSLKWVDTDKKLGLYRCCAGCGDIQCIMHGFFEQGEIQSGTKQ